MADLIFVCENGGLGFGDYTLAEKAKLSDYPHQGDLYKIKTAIEAGTRVVLSDNKEYNFRMTVEDQLNLAEIEAALNNGAEKILYHETDNICSWFSAQDMRTIIFKLRVHKNYHTTFFNLLKYCIINMYSIDEIRSLSYGVELLTLNVSDDILNIVKERL